MEEDNKRRQQVQEQVEGSRTQLDAVSDYGMVTVAVGMEDGNPNNTNPKHRQTRTISASGAALGEQQLGVDVEEYYYRSSMRLGKLLERHGERLCGMGAVDVLRESVEVIKANAAVLASIGAILVCPVSLLLLSRPLLYGYAAAAAAGRGGTLPFILLRHLLPVKPLYESAARALLAFIVASPVLLTLWVFAKAAIASAVYAAYSADVKTSTPLRLRLAFPSILAAAAKSWKRASFTYSWICFALLASAWTTAALFYSLLQTSLLLPPHLLLFSQLALAMFYSILFSHLVVLGNLATIVSVYDQSTGLAAIANSFHLVKPKLHIALTLLFFSTFLTGVVESLYQYRVLGIPASRYPITAASRAWEGPLLLFMHTFLLLADVVIACVLYFACKFDSIQDTIAAMD